MRAAFTNPGDALQYREQRFFALEHPLAMFLAIGLIHTGSTRSRKAVDQVQKWRWATVCYTIAALAIALALPWGRPPFRLPW